MMSIYPRLVFNDIVPGGEFHAAWATQQGREPGVGLHTHDFYEMMYIVEGAGIHRINDQNQPLTPGDLIFIRPDDCHTIRTRIGEKLHFINIAFPGETWRGFLSFTNQDKPLEPCETAAMPPVVAIPGERRAEYSALFSRTLRAFYESPSRLELCRFWTGVLPLLSPNDMPEHAAMGGMPEWLARACREMRDPENLTIGLPRFIALSQVSPAHLARMLKTHIRQTPTEFINELRLQRAAMLLTTSSQEIITIASDCGFDNLSYFYRLFNGYFGKTPRAFRLSAQHVVLP